MFYHSEKFSVGGGGGGIAIKESVPGLDLEIGEGAGIEMTWI